jgi:hypothetical protein
MHRHGIMLGHNGGSRHCWFAARLIYADDCADRRSHDSSYISHDASADGGSQQHPHAAPDDGATFSCAHDTPYGRTYNASQISVGSAHIETDGAHCNPFSKADVGTHRRLFLRIVQCFKYCISH